MRTPQKSLELYEILKNRIRTGDLPAGTLLPRETEQAEEFGVARGTLRTALRNLEEEGLIHRVRGQGTFVADVNKPLTVTYLLPCADYASASGISSHRTHSEMIFGLMQEAVKYNCKIEAIPLTPDNNPQHINWKLLEHLNSDSRVIVVGSWFREIFPLLEERGCRVALILREHENLHPSVPNWQVWQMNDRERLNILKQYLTGRHCRDIARTQSSDTSSAGHIEGVRELKCESDIARLREAVSDGGFDALILDSAIINGIDNRLTIQQNFALPDNLEVVLADRNCFDEAIIRQNASAFFPYQETARQMLAALAAGRYQPFLRQINPKFQGKQI
mgnify:CR=1 FL=1|jgi:DNA-binding transcriptional regulator YhcF (GntR family)